MAFPSFSQKVKPNIAVKEISDIYIRKNFQSLEDYFQSENQLSGFKFFELSFANSEANRKVSHGLGFIPQDILCTKIVGPGTVTFNRNSFTNTQLDVSSSGEAIIRFYVGSYWQNKNSAADPSNAVQEFQAQLLNASSALPTSNILTLFPLTTEQLASGDYPGATATTYYVRDRDNSVYVDCTNGAKSIILPDAKGKAGQRHRVKKVDSTNATNLCTITFFGSQTANSRTRIVLSFLDQSVDFESDGTNWKITDFFTASEILKVSSSPGKVFTATDRYPALNTNSLSITPGTWRLFGDVYFSNSGLSPAYSAASVLWGLANGADTNVQPTPVTTNGNMTLLTSSLQFMGAGVEGSNNDVPAPHIIIQVTNTSTVYLNCYGTMATAARTLVFAYANAERIGP